MTIDEAWLKQRADDLRASILFLTRLRYGPALPVDGTAIAQAAWAFPIAGVLVGLIGAVVYLLAHRMGLPPWPAAALSVAATMAVTGCLHEDGLADTTDGFGGGKTRELKLEIMRDSRIGAYGVCALGLSLLRRASALASLDSSLVLAALIAAHGAARAILPVFMYFVPPARREGLSASAGQPPRDNVIAAAVLGILIVALCFGPVLAIAALILLVAVIALLAWLSLAQIDGQTGDVLGAVEQISEIAILLVALR